MGAATLTWFQPWVFNFGLKDILQFRSKLSWTTKTPTSVYLKKFIDTYPNPNFCFKIFIDAYPNSHTFTKVKMNDIIQICIYLRYSLFYFIFFFSKGAIWLAITNIFETWATPQHGSLNILPSPKYKHVLSCFPLAPRPNNMWLKWGVIGNIFQNTLAQGTWGT